MREHLRKWTTVALLVVVPLTVAAVVLIVSNSRADAWEHPRIAEHGKIMPLPKAAMQPLDNTQYQLVLDVTEGADEPTKVSKSLDKLARTVNLFASAGAERVDIVAVVHGDATHAMLSSDAYQKAFGVDNPNLALIDALAKEGVTIYVCGQALAHRDLRPEQVASSAEPVQAAITTIAELQRRGYNLQAL